MKKKTDTKKAGVAKTGWALWCRNQRACLVLRIEQRAGDITYSRIKESGLLQMNQVAGITIILLDQLTNS